MPFKKKRKNQIKTAKTIVSIGTPPAIVGAWCSDPFADPRYREILSAPKSWR